MLEDDIRGMIEVLRREPELTSDALRERVTPILHLIARFNGEDLQKRAIFESSLKAAIVEVGRKNLECGLVAGQAYQEGYATESRIAAHNADLIGRALSELRPRKVRYNPESGLYVVEGVVVHGQRYNASLSDKFLDGGATRTHNGWVEFSAQSSGLRTPDPEEYAALCDVIVSCESEDAEKARAYLKSTAGSRWIPTLGRVEYNPQGQKDRALHRVGLSDAYAIEVDNITGREGTFTALGDEADDSIHAITGRSPSVLKTTQANITDKEECYHYRLRNKPRNQELRAVWLGGSSVGGDFRVGAVVLGIIGDPSLGVLFERA